MSRPFRVGLSGGIGAGKSAVAECFARRGARVIDADLLARDVVAPGTPGFGEIARRWPAAIVDGTLDRGRLAAIVFADPTARDALNAIVHPRVRARADALERDLSGDIPVVHVVPLLFEGDWWRSCDATVVVVAPREERIARVLRRDGTTRVDVEARMAAQIDPAEARARATFVIENDAGLAALCARSDAVYERISELARERARD